MVEAYLWEDGDTLVRRLDAGTLLWRNPLLGMLHTIIRVVTENALDAFVDDAAASADAFLRIAKKELLSRLRVSLDTSLEAMMLLQGGDHGETQG
jgi:hypothetical protein